MRIEISAGGISGAVAVSRFQSNMQDYVKKTENMISSFTAVKRETYNLNGGVGNLQSAIDALARRVATEEKRKIGAETVNRKTNDFLDLAVRVDKSVATLVDKNKEAFYRTNPWLRPKPSQDSKNFFEKAWDLLCGAANTIASGAKAIWQGISDSVKKAWDNIVAFYQEHKEIIDTVLIVAGTVIAVAIILGLGPFGAGLAAALTTVFGALGLSEATAGIIAGAVAVCAVIGGGLNVATVWGQLENHPILAKIRDTANIIVEIATTFTLVIGTGGLGMKTMIQDAGKLFTHGKITAELAKWAAKISKAVGYSGVVSTIISGFLNLTDTWLELRNQTFQDIRVVFSKLSFSLDALYAAGLLYESIKTRIDKLRLKHSPENPDNWSMDNPRGPNTSYTAKDHLTGAEPGEVRRRQISGAHNMDEFNRLVQERNITLVSRREHPTIKGIYEYTYMEPGTNQVHPIPKTVYDPLVVSNDQIVQWATEAYHNLNKPVDPSGFFSGTASNGLHFNGRVDPNTGVIKTIYPVMDGDSVLPALVYPDDND